VISDPDAEAIFASLQTPEMERRVTRIPSPQTIVLDGEILNFRWQCLEQFPEPAGSDRYHACGGHSRRRPLADSLSASSKRKSSLPAEESESNWSSHRLCSRTRNHWTMRRYSSGGRPSIAASICSTRPMLEVYHHRDLVSSNAVNSRELAVLRRIHGQPSAERLSTQRQIGTRSPPYSWRKATAGSMRVDLRAGR
jgi:hypothetical protein